MASSSNAAAVVEEGDSSNDSEDELPTEWQVRTTDTGRVYYANHVTKTTQWRHPKTGKQRKISGELPSGWQKQYDSKGNVFFADIINQHTTYTDPRLVKKGIPTCIQAPSHRFGASTTAVNVLKGQDLSGRVAIVTGANSGIGYETARALALHGAHVIMACRDLKKAQGAADRIQANRVEENPDPQVEVMLLDLASLDNIRTFAEEFRKRNLPLHILVCNAAVLGGMWQTTENAVEHTFGINYLGHFLLVQLLQDIMCTSAPARVVMVSSESHRFLDFNYSCKLHLSSVPLPKDRYWSILAYNQSKLCCLLFSMELNRRLHSHGVTSNAVHPGNLIYTSIYGRSWMYWALFLLAKPFSKTACQGAATVVYCAASQDLDGQGGQYFINCCPCEPSAEANDPDKARALWDLSISIIESVSYRPGIIDM